MRNIFLFSLLATSFLILFDSVALAQPMSDAPDVGAKHSQNALPIAAPLPKDKPTIAVTTFENLSAYPENDWVAMSFAESLTTNLKRLNERFRVVERLRIYEIIREQGFDPEKVVRLEVTKQRDVGNLIGANYLIIGSVSLQGSADDLKTPLLANMRLVDVKTGEIKEAQGVQGEMQQLFDLEIKLAYALLRQMGIEPTPEEAEKLNLKETLSILANKYYSLGQKAFYEGDYETAKKLYVKALETLGGQYYQAAELSLIDVLERQKAAADEAGKAKVKSEALRRREESESKRAEANQRLFAEARYSMLAEDYETAVERYQQYLDWAKPFRQIKWKRDVNVNPAYQPLLHENTLYVALVPIRRRNRNNPFDRNLGSTSYYFYRLDAVDARTGEVRWQFRKEEPKGNSFSSNGEVKESKSPIVIAEGTVYAPVDNTRIVALDKNTGKLLWEFDREFDRFGREKRPEINDDEWPFPQVMDGLVCIKFYDGILVILSAKTGELKWQFDTGIRSVKSALASDGKIYVGSKDGEIIAFFAQNGDELWRAKLEGAFTLPSPWRYLHLADKAAFEQFIVDRKAQFQAILHNLSREEAKSTEEILEMFAQRYRDMSGILVMDSDQKIGLEGGEIILEVDRTPIIDFKQFVAVIRSKETPTIRTLKILREEKEKNLIIKETDESPDLSSPVIQAGHDILYIATNSGAYGTISALKKTTGEILWEYRAFPMKTYRLIFEGKRLCVYCSSLPFLDRIYVFDAEKGELLWTAKGQNPIVASERIYMSDQGLSMFPQGMTVRSLETGEVIWQAKPHDPKDFDDDSKIVTDDLKTVTETTVYLSSPNFAKRSGQFRSSELLGSKLYALDAKTGEELWQFPTVDRDIEDVLVAEDGTVYLTTGQIYALSPKPKGLLPEQEELESLLGIGTALIAMGSYQEAIPKLKEALELRVDLKESHWQLALAYEGLKQWAEAAKERNEYLLFTPFASARPEVKKHFYEHFGIQKWVSPDEPDFDIHRHIPNGFLDNVAEMGAMPRRLKWGGVTIPTFMEGKLYLLPELYEFGIAKMDYAAFSTLVRREEWKRVEVLGQEYINRISQMMRSGEGIGLRWFELSYRYSNDKRIYIEFILMDTTSDDENKPEYQIKSILGAFSQETGKLLWKFQTERSNRTTMKFFISALLVSDMVYWGIEGRLYALDKETGTLIWEFHDEATPRLFSQGRSIEKKGDDFTAVIGTPTSSERQTLLVAAEGSVYIIDRELLFALSAQTGKLLWQKSIPNLYKFKSPVRIHAGCFYAVTGNELYALQADTGETNWSIKVDGDISGCVLDEERVYVRTAKKLHVFSSETGKFQWEFSSSLEYSPAVTYDIIVGEKTVYLCGKTFYALDKATGEVKWGIAGFRHSLAGIEVEEVLYLYSSSDLSVLYAFDLAQIDKLRAEGKQWW